MSAYFFIILNIINIEKLNMLQIEKEKIEDLKQRAENLRRFL